MVHDNAVIDPKAELDEGVTVGPFAVIGADVKIGKGTIIGPHAVIQGPTTIGEDNHIFQFASVGEAPQDLSFEEGQDTRLEVGDRNVIREYATLHRGTLKDEGVTSIGNDNLLMAYTHIAHDCRLGNHIILSNAASLGGHVIIEDHVILGGFVTVHQFCRLGAHSFAGMNSGIKADVLPFVIVDGHPAYARTINKIGLERRGFSKERIRTIHKAFSLACRGGTVEEAIAALKAMPATDDLNYLIQFLERSLESKRPLIRVESKSANGR